MSNYIIYTIPTGINLETINSNNIMVYQETLKGSFNGKNIDKLLVDVLFSKKDNQQNLPLLKHSIALIYEGSGKATAYACIDNNLTELSSFFQSTNIKEELNLMENIKDNRLSLAEKKQYFNEVWKKTFNSFINKQKYQQLLDIFVALYRYGFKNSLLIYSQCPQSRYIANYNEWQKLGRRINEGEKAINLFVRSKFIETTMQERLNAKNEPVVDINGDVVVDSITKETEYSALTKVFDISQTYQYSDKDFTSADKIIDMYGSKDNLFFSLIALLNISVIFKGNEYIQTKDELTMPINYSIGMALKRLLIFFIDNNTTQTKTLENSRFKLKKSCIKYIVLKELGYKVPDIDFNDLPTNDVLNFFKEIKTESKLILLKLYNFINSPDLCSIAEYKLSKNYDLSQLRTIQFFYNSKVSNELLKYIIKPAISSELMLVCNEVYNNGIPPIFINILLFISKQDISIFKLLANIYMACPEDKRLLVYALAEKNRSISLLQLIEKLFKSGVEVSQINVLLLSTLDLDAKYVIYSAIYELNNNPKTNLDIEKLNTLASQKDSIIMAKVLEIYMSGGTDEAIEFVKKNPEINIKDLLVSLEVKKESKNPDKTIDMNSFSFIMGKAQRNVEAYNLYRKQHSN